MVDYEITVDVSDCNIETKKKVQDAFFKLGFKWLTYKGYVNLHAISYSNKFSYMGKVNMHLTFNSVSYRKATHTIDELLELAGMTTNLMPFDLEKALAGDEVVTRDGRKVRQITLFDCVSDYPLIAVVDKKIRNYSRAGSYTDGTAYEYDLFMKANAHTVNGFVVPVPITDPKLMRQADTYYVSDNTQIDWYFEAVWINDTKDNEWMSRNLVFMNKEDAISNAKAASGINPYGESDE